MGGGTRGERLLIAFRAAGAVRGEHRGWFRRAAAHARGVTLLAVADGNVKDCRIGLVVSTPAAAAATSPSPAA